MAFASSKGSVFKLDNAAGSLVDLSAYVESIDPTFEIENVDVTTLGQAGRRNMNTLENHSFSVSLLYDRTAAASWAHMTGIFNLASGATQTFEIYPEGTTTGYPKVSGECRLTSLSLPIAVGDKLRLTCQFKVDGVVAYGTAA